MEPLPHGVIFLGDGCKLWGYPTELTGDSDKPLDELGQEGDSGGFGADGVGQRFSAKVRKALWVAAEDSRGLGQLFRHEA